MTTNNNNERDLLLDRLHQMNASISVIRNDVELMKKYYDKIDTVLDKMNSQYISIAMQEQKLGAITNRIHDLERLVKDVIETVKVETKNTVRNLENEQTEIRRDIAGINDKVSYFDQVKWKVVGAVSAGAVLLSVIDVGDIIKVIIGQ